MKTEQVIHPVYFLFGPEDYLIEEEVQGLLNQTLSPKEKGLNFHLFNGGEHSGHEIVQAAQTIPMFSRYRFILVREVDLMAEDQMEVLLGYIRNPSQTTRLVLNGRVVGHWKSHRHEIEKVGKVVEFSRLKGKALISWMRSRMAERRKRLSEDAAEYLVEGVGDHLQDLDNALEKVFLSVGERKTVELSDAEGIASGVKLATVFDLMDAIGNQDLEKAFSILERAMESKTIPFKKDEETSKKMDDPVPLLLSMMARQYWAILRVKKMVSDKMEEGEIAKRLKTSPWNVRKLMNQCKNFSESSLREGIIRCHQADLSVKGGRGSKELLMEKLVIDLCRGFE
jgi:DNA polymerase III subunit delta